MEQYEKLLALGQGGSADVFLARGTRTRALVAVKRVRVVPGKRLRDRAAVLREVAILRQLRHPHVVACLGHFFDAGEQHLFIVQEFCAGGSLDRHIRARRGAHFSEGTVMRFFVQLALAVQHIHARRILHRDIKPSNVFLTQAGRLKLGDFGIAKVLESSASLARTFVGTPYYLSPELCADVPYSAKADVWALGCLLFELCALRPPFQALSLMGLFKQIVEGAQAPIPRCYSGALQGLVRSILQKDPAARPSACSLLAIPYVQEHLRLFRPQEAPRLPLPGPRVGWDGGGQGGSPPEPPPGARSRPGPGPALPATLRAPTAGRAAQRLRRRRAEPLRQRLPVLGRLRGDQQLLLGQQLCAGHAQHHRAHPDRRLAVGLSTKATCPAPPAPRNSRTLSPAAEESGLEWELTEYPADSEDSEEGSLAGAEVAQGAALREGQFSPAPFPHGGVAGPCWARKGEDGPCGSDGGSGTTELVVVALAAAAQACGEQSSSTEDSEPWDTARLLRLLDLDSP
ncbi:hypothetical protein lerEdw1_009122 [Lerista edwardsae]|nr:hypothetical protein lerEdw1_009122 [Lerista edwardsae]